MKIKIGYIEYNLINARDPKCLGKSVNGSINFNLEKITVKKSLKGSARTQVILHEVIHAIDEYLDIGLSEEKTDKVAKGLTSFFKDNKELVKELLGEE